MLESIIINFSLTSETEMALLLGGSAFMIAWALGSVFTSSMITLSWRWGALDRPDGSLKCHGKATATLGGVPLFGAMLLGVLILFSLDNIPCLAGVAGWHLSYGALLVAGVIILSVGICDDLRHVMPRTKMLFQMLASTILVGSGLVIRSCDFFGMFEISLGALAVPFTLFWLIGSCNAFNFIDGMDGLASGLGLVTTIVLSILGIMTGSYAAAILALSAGGGLLAILLFNIKPASIFLGDSGSQLVGLLLGALAIKIANNQGSFMLPAAGLILSIPVIDALLAIIRRRSSAESMAKGDHRHIHHCLRNHGLSVNQVAITLWLAAALAGTAGIACFYLTGWQAATASLVFVVLQVYTAAQLGCVKLRKTSEIRKSEMEVQLENELSRYVQADLDLMWNRMKPLFQKLKLDRATLTLESLDAQGLPQQYEYKWSRTQEALSDMLASRWSKRFSLDHCQEKLATLRLEAADNQERDEQHIANLLNQISRNMQRVAQGNKTPTAEPADTIKVG